MRRPSGFLVACVTMVLSLCLTASGRTQAAAQPQAGAQPGAAAQPAAPADPPLTFDSDVVLWGFSIAPDKTADYEKVLEKLKTALKMIKRPEAAQQLAAWKIIKNSKPQTDGTILYVHVLNPVVKGADYSIMHLYYEAFPEYKDRKEFYDLYAGTKPNALFAIQGPTTDFSK